MKRIIPLLVLFFCTAEITSSQQIDLLFELIANNDILEFKKTIKRVEDVDAMVNEDGFTLLCYSIHMGKTSFAKLLMDKDANIEHVCNKKTPLMYSCYHGNDELLRYLIKKGADVNRRVEDLDAVKYALSIQNFSAVKVLEKNGANVGLKITYGPYLMSDVKGKFHYLIHVNEDSKLVEAKLKEKPSSVLVNFLGNKNVAVDLKDIVDEKQCEFSLPDKIFAIADIEGNYKKFHQSLIGNGVIDKNLNWSFGNGSLVLLGDFVDRGDQVSSVLWLIYKLEQEALNAGGKVHFILGNHEVMNMQEDYRYSSLEYFLLPYYTKYGIADFYSNKSELGRWMRSKNVIEKIGNHLFVHGGVSDSLLAYNLSLQEINNIARNNFDTPELSDTTNIVLNDDGVLWFRGLVANFQSGYKVYPKVNESSVDNILTQYSVDNITVGHCVVPDISTDFNNKVIRIDINHDKTISAGILIEDGVVYKTTVNGEKFKLVDLK